MKDKCKGNADVKNTVYIITGSVKQKTGTFTKSSISRQAVSFAKRSLKSVAFALTAAAVAAISVFLLSAVPARAESETAGLGQSSQNGQSGLDTYRKYYDAAGVDDLKQSLDDSTISDLYDLGIDPENPYSDGLSAKSVFEKLFEKLKTAFVSPFTALSGVAAALILCSAFGTLSKNGLSDTADFTAAVCISGIAVVPFCSAIASAVNTISLCCTFIISFVPIYCGILLCMGSAAFSSAVSAAVFGLAQVVSALAGTVITPFSGMYIALSVSCSFSPEMRLRGLTSAVKKAVFWILGIAMTVFSAVLGITGSINSAADTVSVKTARFFLSNSVPVVGGAITDAVGTLAGSISVLRSGVGAFGICALLLLILPALLQMLLWKASLSVMSAAAELFGQKRCGELLKGLGDGAGLLLSIILSAGVLFLVTFVILFLGGKQLWEA